MPPRRRSGRRPARRSRASGHSPPGLRRCCRRRTLFGRVRVSRRARLSSSRRWRRSTVGRSRTSGFLQARAPGWAHSPTLDSGLWATFSELPSGCKPCLASGRKQRSKCRRPRSCWPSRSAGTPGFASIRTNGIPGRLNCSRRSPPRGRPMLCGRSYTLRWSCSSRRPRRWPCRQSQPPAAARCSSGAAPRSMRRWRRWPRSTPFLPIRASSHCMVPCCRAKQLSIRGHTRQPTCGGSTPTTQPGSTHCCPLWAVKPRSTTARPRRVSSRRNCGKRSPPSRWNSAGSRRRCAATRCSARSTRSTSSARSSATRWGSARPSRRSPRWRTWRRRGRPASSSCARPACRSTGSTRSPSTPRSPRTACTARTGMRPPGAGCARAASPSRRSGRSPARRRSLTASVAHARGRRGALRQEP